jgi:hypothetical protein
MAEVKKSYAGALIFSLFVLIFPLVTVFFSKSGLDKYKDMRGQMEFLKDSIRVNFDDTPMYWNAKLDNEFIQGKLILVGFWEQKCQEAIDESINKLKEIHGQFNKLDKNKILFIIHAEDYTSDSTWALDSYVDKWQVDTSIWKFSKSRASFKNYKLKGDKNCSTVVMLDGRVSRKDGSGDYKKGPLLCSRYDIHNKEEMQQLLRDMAIIMPAKQRKSIVYKPEEKLY